MSEQTPHGEGKIEKFLGKNFKKSLLILGGLAVASILLPPAGAAVASAWAGGTAAEAAGSKLLQDHLKQKRLRGH